MSLVRQATDDDLDTAFRLAEGSRSGTGASSARRDEFVRRWTRSETWVAEEDGAVVGFVALASGVRADRYELTHVASAAVGAALLDEAEARSRASGAHALVTTLDSTDGRLVALLARRGFRLGREVLRMWRTLGDEPGATWPPGVCARAYVDDDARSVHALLDDAYAGWDDDYEPEPHDRWLAEMTGDADFDPGLWFVVERDRELVACCLAWVPSAGYGWIKDLAVRAGERGNGIGGALLQHSFAEYARRGVARVGLKVDASNPTGAVRLYERTGFRTDCRYEIWTKQL